MLTVEEIYRTYHFGPRAIIELLEKHLGQAYLHPAPPESMLEKTIQGQIELIEQLEKQMERLQEQLKRERYHSRTRRGTILTSEGFSQLTPPSI
jgi:hypothetical protein